MRAVNLIPAEQRGGVALGAGRSQGAAYAVLALVGGLAILALLYGVARHQVSSNRAKVASLSARAQRAQAEAARLAPYTSFIALREARVATVSQLVNSRFDWAHALYQIGNVLPSGASISSLSGTVGSTSGPGAGSAGGASAAAGAATGSSAVKGGSVSSATPPGSVPTFTLGGCATSQAEVALTLDRQRLIDGVSDVALQGSTKTLGGGSGSSGGCPAGDPAYTMQVTFAPLPSPSLASTGGVK
jgi:Tfp pilus assembly protein PilN